MQAAEKLFTSRRVDEITLDDVVLEARVGKGTVYRYFKDKDDLFFQTARWGFDQLCELLVGEAPSGAPFEERLLRACRQISDFFQARRQWFRLMQTEESRMLCGRGQAKSQWLQQRAKLVSAVAAVIRIGVDEGKVRDDVPAEVLASFLLGMLRTRARDLAETPPAQRDLRLVADLFCEGAGRRPRQSCCPATVESQA